MIARRQFRDSDAMPIEENRDEGPGQLHNELRRSAAVSGKPVDHPYVGGVVFGFPGRSTRVSPPVRVREPPGVLVVGIACVRVLEGRLRKRKQQARHYTQMENPSHYTVLIVPFLRCGRPCVGYRDEKKKRTSYRGC
jgi:hypothetical protein